MRLKPVAPIILLEASEPKVVGDIAIPAGTVVAAIETQDGRPVEEWLSVTMSPSRLLMTLKPRE
jgi:hypothetical protein